MTRRDRHSAAEAGTFDIGGDLPVNRLGFGAMRLTGSRAWGLSAVLGLRGEADKVLRRALGLGVSLIDTADFYGPEANENLIRETLHPYPEGVLVATKGVSSCAGRETGIPTEGPNTCATLARRA